MEYMEPGKFSESGNPSVIRSPKLPSTRTSFALRRSSSVSNEDSKVDLNSVSIRSVSDPHTVKDSISNDSNNNGNQNSTPSMQYSAITNIQSPPALPSTLSKISSASSLSRITSSNSYSTNTQTATVAALVESQRNLSYLKEQEI
ncbi:unnamed protein product [[Candida] boidinii]|nr:unnamed protein product [[Candida] boidinii]